jgi:hypothetical protein
MLLWEYLFRADERLDLSAAGKAEQWLRSQRWWPKDAHGKGDTSLFDDRSRARWEQNISCLRILVPRLKGIPSKRLKRLNPIDEAMRSSHAESVLASYLSKLRVVYVSGQAVLLPTNANDRPRSGALTYHYAADEMRIFWQGIFYSLVQPDAGMPPAPQVFLPVCERCGIDVGGKTKKKGRERKRRLCDRCRWRKWREKQPSKKMRAKWRKDKKNHLT